MYYDFDDNFLIDDSDFEDEEFCCSIITKVNIFQTILKQNN